MCSAEDEQAEHGGGQLLAPDVARGVEVGRVERAQTGLGGGEGGVDFGQQLFEQRPVALAERGDLRSAESWSPTR
ncbi:MAG: hypothetical protein R2724_15675 [Bryobacterales bacterium]